MDEHEKDLKEQLAVEKFLEADKVFSRDPADFQDKDGDKIDDRAE